MKRIKKFHIILFTFIISVLSIVYRVNNGMHSDTGSLFFLGMVSFPISIVLCYFMNDNITFLDKMRTFLFSILIGMPVLFTQLYIEDYFIQKELTKNGKTIKCLINDYSLYSKGTTYYFSYIIDNKTYSESVNLHGSNYFRGDTIELLVSTKNPTIYKIKAYLKKN